MVGGDAGGVAAFHTQRWILFPLFSPLISQLVIISCALADLAVLEVQSPRFLA